MNTETEILHFIKEKEQTGALLLTGQWGSGKSYLIKEFAKKTNTKYSDYYISIISLFGIDNVATLNRCVKEAYLAASSGVFTKTVQKVSKGIGQLIKSGAEVASAADPTSGISAGLAKGIGNAMTLNVFEYIPVNNEFGRGEKKKQFVLTFDDLERCKIDIVELLGTINEFSENKKIKTIIVADENKILKREDAKDYLDFKEKIIFQTIRLQSDYNMIIDGIIDRYKETAIGYSEFLKTCSEIIKQVFAESNYRNVRTVKAILASFERVFAEWLATTIPTVRIVDVFYSYCAIYFEHKANAYNKTAYGYYEDKTIKEKYSKYDSFYVLSSVRNWITDGYWNTVSFKRELTNKFGVENVSDSQRFLQHDFWELDENIIQNGLPVVLNEAYDGNLCFDDIISLLQRLRLLESYNVSLPLEASYEKIEDGLNERLRKIRNGIISEPKKRTFIHPEDARKLNSVAQKIYESIEIEDDRKESWKTRSSIILKLKCFEGVNIYAFKNHSIVSFDEEFFEAYYEAYVKANNGEKRELFFLLKNADFSNTTISRKSDLETTISNLEALIGRLDALYESTADTFTKIILKSTIEAIPEIIDDVKESLEKAKQ